MPLRPTGQVSASLQARTRQVFCFLDRLQAHEQLRIVCLVDSGEGGDVRNEVPADHPPTL